MTKVGSIRKLIVIGLGAVLFCMESMGTIEERVFGSTAAGASVTLIVLENASGSKVEIINYGAIVVSLSVLDRFGDFDDVVIGYDNMTDYEERSHNFGAIIGRYASRITGARFSFDGVDYELPANSGPHCVHGGPIGFDKVVWSIKEVIDGINPSVVFEYVSADGEMGFPGELTTAVTYTLTEENGLRIDYEARTTKATPVNFTNHSYFNLKGDGNGNVLDHLLQIAASRTPTAPNSVPTGEIESVTNTPLDFRTFERIGERIDHPSFETRRGYNHYFIMDDETDSLTLAATLKEETSGRILEVWTTEPGLQLYTGNWLNADLVGKSGKPYTKYGGVCLETQHYPDSPNQPQFPNTFLLPGEVFKSTTIYHFEVDQPAN